MQERKKLAARLEKHKASFKAMEDSLDRVISCVSQWNTASTVGKLSTSLLLSRQA